MLGFKEVLKTNLGDWGQEVDDGISEGVHHWAKIRATSSLIKSRHLSLVHVRIGHESQQLGLETKMHIILKVGLIHYYIKYLT